MFFGNKYPIPGYKKDYSLLNMIPGYSVYKYVTTDQEKEGKELAIKNSAKHFQPILNELEDRLTKLKVKRSNEKSYLKGRTDELFEQISYYEEEIKKFDSILQHSKIANYDYMSISLPDMYGCIFIPSFGFDFFEKLMDKKRFECYQKEYKKQAKIWGDKIDEIRHKILEELKKLLILKTEGDLMINDCLEALQNLVDEYTKKKNLCELLKEKK